MRNTSFIMGLIGGLICCLFSTILFAVLMGAMMDEAAVIVTITLLFVISLLFIVGVSMVLTRGGAGGVIMIVSSCLIFILAIALLSIEFFQGGLEVYGALFISLAIMGFISGMLGYKSRHDPKKSKRSAAVVPPRNTTNRLTRKFCEKCGQELTLDVVFCPNCGKKS